MKLKPESITWKVDREYSRWYAVETHGESGCRKHKVLVTAWRDDNSYDVERHWQARIVVPYNVSLGSLVFQGKTRKKAVNEALAEFEKHLRELGEWA